MKIEIDQSGRIEDTSKLSVVAYSNDHHKSLLITARDKKTIQVVFRKMGQPKLFVYKLFAVAIFVLIKNELKRIDQIIIDREYTGYENLIKQLIFEIAERNKKEIEKDIIHFHSIGRRCNAHGVSIKAYRMRRADIRLSAKEFFEIGVVK
ncbi:MAG: Uncharacterized protein CEN92_235 [Candidatus Berkelbacteria bacterium Licking1014_96]|uniref:Uncharacterized protein n=1 Tax=Candidatus Berkelbacteria bacterium Licking1014_96 TaxID=2017149 RepID=A0A554LFK5_9BACT|nr:MAG: Uncharacterized protein CEN92_235 [Candidatus Berkelbacteria bacterium Licking1014_96]